MARWYSAIGVMIFLSICWLCCASLVSASPFVTIKNGTLKGTFMLSKRGREFVAFRGIPYAQPPVGELRFEPPKSFDSWTGIRSAEKDADMCIQRDIFTGQKDIIGVEDCLYLNVYSPQLPTHEIEEEHANYPVMIWIHGGAWITGSGSSMIYGPTFFLDHDIVLVTINYRLGPLGFLSTEDLVSPGNQGLKDQSQAIRWVRENIAAFGGDPNRMTIFGESAGAASVHYHMISPLTKGLFHRAISQSGNVLCPWALSRPGIARDRTNRLGKLLDCPTDESKLLIDCLRKKDSVDIIATDYDFLVYGMCPLVAFRPVIEPDHPGAFIKEETAWSLKVGNVVDVPWMTGLTSGEGALKIAGIFGAKNAGYDKQLDENFMELAPMSLLYEDACPDYLKNNVTKSIREFYLGDKKIDESTRMDLVDLYTDAWILAPTDNVIRDHLATLNSPIYYYYFKYRGTFSLSVILGDAERDYGACHGDDLFYLFPFGDAIYPGKAVNEEDHKIVDLMTSLWVNFATSGNPTPEKTLEIPIKWRPVRTSRLEYLHIGGIEDLRMESDLFPDRMNFWRSIPHGGKSQLENDAHRDRDEL